MKALLVLITLSALSGCVGVQRISNDMIIAEAMKCEQAGLPWRQLFNYDGSVSNVYCAPHMDRRLQ